MLFNIYVGKVLYFSTENCERAFDLFKAFVGSPGGCNMQFVPLKKRVVS